MPFRRRRSVPFRLDGRLLLRVQNPPDLGDEPVTLEADAGIELFTVQLDDGGSALPAFTGEKQRFAWDPDGGPWIEIDARAAAALAHGHGFDVLVVDPASDSWALPREQLAELPGTE